MDELGKVTLHTISLFGHAISYNPITFIMTWLVMAIVLVLSYFAAKKLSVIPEKLQSVFELIHEFLYDIVISTLGEEDGKKYFPFIMAIFIFILMANWIGILPNFLEIFGFFFAAIHKLFGGPVQFVSEGLTQMSFVVDPSVWYSGLLEAPGIEEPTRSVNTDLALALLVFFVCQGYGIKKKGLFQYIRNFADDPFPMNGIWIVFFFINPFFYLNLIGTVANVVSHSFRLFGNIFGGGMIIVIVSSLLHYFLVPVGLFAFFGLFAGLVQAFVFTMLTVTYIQQQQ
jgi:F-type H+-transporting ATPase subunit a